MARLLTGEKEEISSHIHHLLRKHNNGLRESDLAALTQMDRRRINNYLRDLEAQAKAYKDGWEWYAE